MNLYPLDCIHKEIVGYLITIRQSERFPKIPALPHSVTKLILNELAITNKHMPSNIKFNKTAFN